MKQFLAVCSLPSCCVADLCYPECLLTVFFSSFSACIVSHRLVDRWMIGARQKYNGEYSWWRKLRVCVLSTYLCFSFILTVYFHPPLFFSLFLSPYLQFYILSSYISLPSFSHPFICLFFLYISTFMLILFLFLLCVCVFCQARQCACSVCDVSLFSAYGQWQANKAAPRDLWKGGNRLEGGGEELSLKVAFTVSVCCKC